MDPKFFGNLCQHRLWHMCLQAHPLFQKSYMHTVQIPHNKHKTCLAIITEKSKCINFININKYGL